MLGSDCMTRVLTSILSAVALSAVTIAQAPTPTPPVSSPAPTISDTLKLQLDNAGLRQRIAVLEAQKEACEARVAKDSSTAAITEVQQSVTALILAFEKEHPGWTLDLKTLTAVRKK